MARGVGGDADGRVGELPVLRTGGPAPRALEHVARVRDRGGGGERDRGESDGEDAGGAVPVIVGGSLHSGVVGRFNLGLADRRSGDLPSGAA